MRKREIIFTTVGAVIVLTWSFFLSSVRIVSADTTVNCQSIYTVVPSNALNVSSYGAKGDGVTDDTTSIQNAINDAAAKNLPLSLPAGTYMVKVGILNAKDNSQLYFATGAIIKAFPVSTSSYHVFTIANVSNVAIVGGTIAGERNEHTGTGGEWGMALFVSNASNVFIKGMTLRDGWGDGLYVTNKTSNLNVCYDTMTNNRRNNISVIDGTNLTFQDLTLTNANGTAPQDGIDFEPDSGNSINGSMVENSTITNNTGSGVEIVGNAGPVQNITIKNNTITNSGHRGFLVQYAGPVFLENNTITNSNTSNGSYNDIDANNDTALTITSNTFNSTNVKNAILFAPTVTSAIVTNNCLLPNGIVTVPSGITVSNNGTCQTSVEVSPQTPISSGGSPSVDATPPVISIDGDNPLILRVGQLFQDPGVTAKDNIDGDITASIVTTGGVNTALAGSYTIYYQVSDSAGNRTSASRTIIIKAPVATAPPAPPAPVAVPITTTIAPSTIAPTPVTTPAASLTTSVLETILPFLKNKNTPQKAPALISSTALFSATSTTTVGKKNYTIAKVTYTLNGTIVHVSTYFPDNWQLDTTHLSDGVYTMTSVLQYGDGSIETNPDTFTVDNTPNLLQRIITFVKKIL